MAAAISFTKYIFLRFNNYFMNMSKFCVDFTLLIMFIIYFLVIVNIIFLIDQLNYNTERAKNF